MTTHTASSVSLLEAARGLVTGLISEHDTGFSH